MKTSAESMVSYAHSRSVCYRGQRDGEVDYSIAATSVKGGCISAFGANDKLITNPIPQRVMSETCGTKSDSASTPHWDLTNKRSCANSTPCYGVGPTTTDMEPPSGPLNGWTIWSSGNSGAGPNDAIPTSRPPGGDTGTSRLAHKRDSSAYGSPRKRAKAKCWRSTWPPAPKYTAISKSEGPQTPTTHITRDTSNSVALSLDACVAAQEPPRRPQRQRKGESSHIGCKIPPRAQNRVHRLERLEPYEGKLSRTVLRGGRAGNSPLPLGPASPGKPKNVQKHTQ